MVEALCRDLGGFGGLGFGACNPRATARYKRAFDFGFRV